MQFFLPWLYTITVVILSLFWKVYYRRVSRIARDHMRFFGFVGIRRKLEFESTARRLCAELSSIVHKFASCTSPWRASSPSWRSSYCSICFAVKLLSRKPKDWNFHNLGYTRRAAKRRRSQRTISLPSTNLSIEITRSLTPWKREYLWKVRKWRVFGTERWIWEMDMYVLPRTGEAVHCTMCTLANIPWHLNTFSTRSGGLGHS